MAKNTGMNATDEKAGRTAKLSPDQAKSVTKILDAEKNDPAPTKTISMLNKARENKRNETMGVLLMHKPLAKTMRGKKSS